GAILAGGGATRFGGTPKGLEQVGGRRVIDRLVDAFVQGIGEPPLLVANAPEASAWCPGIRVVRDLIPGAGSLGGLYTAVEEAPALAGSTASASPTVSARAAMSPGGTNGMSQATQTTGAASSHSARHTARAPQGPCTSGSWRATFAPSPSMNPCESVSSPWTPSGALGTRQCSSSTSTPPRTSSRQTACGSNAHHLDNWAKRLGQNHAGDYPRGGVRPPWQTGDEHEARPPPCPGRSRRHG
ncbi:MAG: hypothetical protein E4H37_03390, partial [Gemmatimonadales bacterium]